MAMDKIEELLKTRAEIDLKLEKMRTPITILFSDIRGSTAFFEAEGDVQGLAMVDHHNRILFPIIERHGGRVVKTIGDAIMASFGGSEDALHAAIGMQQAMAAHNLKRSTHQQIHIRIGVHSGLGLVKDGDVYGDVVNTASRVETHSEPDQIYISSELIPAANALGVVFQSAGSAELKGKAETVELFKLDWQSFAETAPAAAPVESKRRSLVPSWVLASLIVIALGVGTAVWMRMGSSVSPAVGSTPAPVSHEPVRPSATTGLTGGQLSDLLVQSPVAKTILQKAGKPTSRDALLNGALRGLQVDAAEKPVTRAEAALVLEDLLSMGTGNAELPTKYLGTDSSPFSDVQTSHPAFNAIMTVTSLRLLPARAQDRFAPSEPVTEADIQRGLKQIEAGIQQQ